MFRQYFGLPRNIYIIALQRFVNSLGGFVFPFLTLFLSKRLGMTEEAIGGILLVAAFMQMPGSLISGAIADRMNRKFLVIVPRLISAVIFIVCGFMGENMTIPYLIVVAHFFGSFSGPATNAMTTDLTTPDNRKQSFSLLYLAMNVGLAFGFVMAGYLFEVNWRWLFWGDGITSLLALSLLIIFVKDTRPDKEAIDEINNDESRLGEKEESGWIFSALIKRPFLLAFVFINTLVFFVYNQHGFIMPFQLENLFPDQGAKMFGHVMTFNTVIVIFLTPLIVQLTSKFKPLVNIMISTATYAVGFGMLAFASNMWGFSIVPFGVEALQLDVNIFYISAFIWTIGEIISTVNSGVYISNHSPVNHRARFGAVMGLIFGSGRSLSPWLMGLFLAGHSYAQGWLLTAGVAILALLLLFTLYNVEKKVKGKAVEN